MHWSASAAMSVVGVPDTFERNMCIKIGLATSRIKRQVVITMVLNVVQHKTSFFFSGADATSSLYMRCVRSSCLAA